MAATSAGVPKRPSGILSDMPGLALKPSPGTNWRLPDKWIGVFEAYLAHVKGNPQCVGNPDGVIDDLESVLRLLREAQVAKCKWRLMVDY